ncbi:MAG: hypothetical protein ICV77_00250 [Cyanobacteria bacterium Co-bin8]|nr:hypothetical protein [Cyanobacteria bacterium Co-bin8]
MKMPPQQKLRTNPFLTYRDPDTGYWVTVIPKSGDRPEPVLQRPPQVFRVVDPDDFQQMNLRSA